ncbi:MAG: amidase family protein [Candidatus Hodgkinia cicadicola]
MRVRFLIKKRLTSLLKSNVGLVTPTAPKLNLSLSSNNKLQWETDVYTVLSSITGLPSIQVPTGLDKNSLSFGVQIIGNAFDEASLICACSRLQKSVATVSSMIVDLLAEVSCFWKYASNIVVSKV